ncbi:NAD(P)/FAD-dependent oxidoreductase [Oryzobacter telluris]|uniref:NAD(P)/FAD-dependent oxidoreductase n=1 Tax=Oryzobacter telluris TaxID=3149179 RepID=UPI00370D4BC3
MDTPHAIDVAVIGGGPAGLQAALTIGRVHRRATLFDDGRYRNATVAHMHNVVTHDGTPPAEFRATARAQLAAYATVDVREERVETVAPLDGGGFLLTGGSGHEVVAAAVVLATGLRDELPGIEGLDALWGDLVAACPFCHGHEAAGRRVGILGSAAAPHLSRILGPVAGSLVVLPHEDEAPDGLPDGVAVAPGRVERAHRDGDEVVLTLADGREERVAALFVAPRFTQSAPFAAQLGLELNPSGCIRVDELGRTSVAGVSAGGDLAHQAALPMPMVSVVQAMAGGQLAASGALMGLLSAAH